MSKTQHKKVNSAKLNNSLSGLVAGIVPIGGAAGGRTGSLSPNSINSTATLQMQVRGEFVTLNYQLLSFLYQQFGVVQALIEVPVLDAFRGGVKFSAFEKKVLPPMKKKKNLWSFFKNEEKQQQKDPAKEQFDIQEEMLERRAEWEREQVKKDEELKKADDSYLRNEISKEELRRIQIYVRREQIWIKLQQALYWKRLYGGGGIVVLDGRNPKTELKLEDINEDTDLEFYVADNWELSSSDTNALALSNIDWMSDTPFTLKGHAIHKSRVIILKGKEFPSFYRAVGRGWGMSILEPLIRTLNKSIKNENVIFELLDEAKTDVFQLSGLNDSLQDDDATKAITQRVSLANYLKNYLKALLLDSEDKYTQKQLSFGGLADLKIDTRVDLAADARIVMNKLYGTSPAGFNSGEADRETYADAVEAEIRVPAENPAIRLLEICGRKVLGKTLDFEIEWENLIKTSAYDTEKMKTLKLANLNEASMFGRITNKEWQEAVNKYDLLGLEVSYKEKFAADPMVKQVFKPGFGGGGK
mgnify:CR=1 FL=1